MWKPSDPLRCLLVPSVVAINAVWPEKGSDSSRMKVWVTSPVKSARPAKVIAEGEGI